MSSPGDDFGRRIAAGKGDASVIVPAATVILLRDTETGPETLMLRKNSKIAFGGMWVFPGGRVDDEDAPGESDEARARAAAVREAAEETSISITPESLVWFSHWTPPPVDIRRFSTWFFAARSPADDHVIDDGEITESQWIRPADALAKQRSGEIQLVPPTYVTLHYLAQHAAVDDLLRGLVPTGGPRHYVTQIATSDDGMVVLWEEDAGYEQKDAAVPGPRHRLFMAEEGWVFDDSALG